MDLDRDWGHFLCHGTLQDLISGPCPACPARQVLLEDPKEKGIDLYEDITILLYYYGHILELYPLSLKK